MNVLHIIERPGGGTPVLEPEGFFAHPVNRYRDIQVDDPQDPFGMPIYSGPAYLAPTVLVPGAYWWVYADEDVYSD